MYRQVSSLSSAQVPSVGCIFGQHCFFFWEGDLLASTLANFNVDGFWSQVNSSLTNPKPINAVQHHLNRILISNSFVSCHEAHATCVQRICGYHRYDFSLVSPGRSVPHAQPNSTHDMFLSSAFCRLWCPSGHFATTEISHHDQSGQCVNSCSSLSCAVAVAVDVDVVLGGV